MTSRKSGSVELNDRQRDGEGIRRGQAGQGRELTHMKTNRENDDLVFRNNVPGFFTCAHAREKGTG